MNTQTQWQIHELTQGKTPKTYKDRFADLLNWKVERKQIAAIDVEEEHDTPSLLRTKDYKANVRADTKRVLGVVGNRYTIVQNDECLQFCEEFAEKVEGSTVESCGLLDGGARVWYRIRLPQNLTSLNFIPKLMILNSHDGTTGVMFKVAFCTEDRKFVPTKGRHTVRHTLNAEYRMKEIKNILKTASAKIAEYGDGLTKAMTYAMDKHARRAFFKRVLEIQTDLHESELNKRQRDALSDLESCAQSHIAKTAAYEDTAFQAFLAVVSFANIRAYERVGKGDKHETAMKRMVDGSCGEMVENAFDEIAATVMQNSLAKAV